MERIRISDETVAIQDGRESRQAAEEAVDVAKRMNPTQRWYDLATGGLAWLGRVPIAEMFPDKPAETQ